MRLCLDCPHRHQQAPGTIPTVRAVCSQAHPSENCDVASCPAPCMLGLPRHDTSVFAAQHEAVLGVRRPSHTKQPPTRQHGRQTVAGA